MPVPSEGSTGKSLSHISFAHEGRRQFTGLPQFSLAALQATSLPGYAFSSSKKAIRFVEQPVRRPKDNG